MQYMLMCYFDEKLWAAMPEPEKGKIMQAYGAWVDSTVKSGHFRASERLQPTSTSHTLRAKNGKPVVIDGPFAETKEQLGGYHVLECQDIDEALSIASRIPTIGVGGVIEVRPFRPPSQMNT